MDGLIDDGRLANLGCWVHAAGYSIHLESPFPFARLANKTKQEKDEPQIPELLLVVVRSGKACHPSHMCHPTAQASLARYCPQPDTVEPPRPQSSANTNTWPATFPTPSHRRAAQIRRRLRLVARLGGRRVASGRREGRQVKRSETPSQSPFLTRSHITVVASRHTTMAKRIPLLLGID